MNWHILSKNEALEVLESKPEGLNPLEIEKRREEYGFNELEEKKRKTALIMLLDQFRDIMILVLIAAAIISGIIGDLKDTLVIMIIVILNAIVGFIQEFRAEKAIEALKQMAAQMASVIREGHVIQLPAAELVPGDIVLLEAGNVVPADIRLLECHALKIDESSLTGESYAVEKSFEKLHDEKCPLGDRVNMAFKGTNITYGRGRGVVVATGMHTELGKIAKLLQEAESKTPLQIRMVDFSKKLSIIILLICVLLFVIGWLRGDDLITMLLTSISLAVAAIPEAMPAVITIGLALGAKRLVKQNALIRKLHAVETLGSVTFICSDKTGTLTQNKMTVVRILEYPGLILNDIKQSPLLFSMILNNDVKKGNNRELFGDPTETALVEYAYNNGYDFVELMHQYPRIAELPFDSERKRMTTIHRLNDKYIVITKGAVESVTRCCMNANIQSIFSELEGMASEGMRVLGFAVKELNYKPHHINIEDIEKELSFVGLAAMIDPPRVEAFDAIKLCKDAGIIPVMITGDHPLTAQSIAKDIGIINSEKDKTFTGAELEKMTKEEFLSVVEEVRVYARVSPEQKLNIVNALQSKNHFVSMTGDGVNDAPSLKKANIGLAMGITGTDVSKEASDMILLDDNFATIVKAVKEGRRIYDNIRKFVKYILIGNTAEILSIMIPPLFGFPIPLLPIHILWINLITDGVPALALAAEPEEKNIMKKAPRKTNESIFSGNMGISILWTGAFTAIITILTLVLAIKFGDKHWQTIVFTVLCLSQLWLSLAVRSERTSFFKQGLFSNKGMLGAFILTFILQLATIYIPFFNSFFNTQPLSILELLLAIGISSLVFWAVEIEKLIYRKRENTTN